MTITTKTGKSTNLSRLTKATNGERTIMPGQNDGIVPTGEVLNAAAQHRRFQRRARPLNRGCGAGPEMWRGCGRDAARVPQDHGWCLTHATPDRCCIPGSVAQCFTRFAAFSFD